MAFRVMPQWLAKSCEPPSVSQRVINTLARIAARPTAVDSATAFVTGRKRPSNSRSATTNAAIGPAKAAITCHSGPEIAQSNPGSISSR